MPYHTQSRCVFRTLFHYTEWEHNIKITVYGYGQVAKIVTLENNSFVITSQTILSMFSC